MSQSVALVAPGPSVAGLNLPLMSTTDSPDFMVNGPAPPVEDARARLRRKQQEANAAKAERRKLRKEVVELDLGANVWRNKGEPKSRSKAKPSGLPRKERSDKGKRRTGELAGQWIFPTAEEKEKRAKLASKRAAAAGAATEEDVVAAAAAQKAAEAVELPPPPPVEHNYVAVLPEDKGLIPDIVNQVGRTAGALWPAASSRRHSTPPG